MSQLPVFDKYFTEEDASYYKELFTNNGLHPVIDQPKQSFNAIFGTSEMDLQYVFRLPAEDFEKANKVLELEMRIKGLPKDYYLHQLSNEELYEVMYKPDEWSRQDVIAARIILEDRGIHIDDFKLAEDKYHEKQRKKKKHSINVAVLALFYIIAPLGALLPIVLGLIIYFMKETDVDGHRDFAFSEKYRRHGIALTIIGIVSLVIWGTVIL